MGVILTCLCGFQFGIASSLAEDGHYRDAAILAFAALAMTIVTNILGWLA